jgi:hypothetical protein
MSLKKQNNWGFIAAKKNYSVNLIKKKKKNILGRNWPNFANHKMGGETLDLNYYKRTRVSLLDLIQKS